MSDTAEDPEALTLLGVQLRRQGQPDAALAAYDRALAIGPGTAPTLVARANVLNDLRRWAEALASAEAALASGAAAWNARGNALTGLRRFEEALASYRQAVDLQPDYADGWFNLGKTLIDLDRPAEAIEPMERVSALEPQALRAVAGRSHALAGLRRYEEALPGFRRVAEAAPTQAAWVDLGMALAATGRHPEALAAFDQAVALDPAAPLARFRRAQARLLVGDFEGGWDDHEHRWDTPVFTARSSGYVPAGLRPRLIRHPKPADFAGQRVLVAGEQGVGDQIMFASVLPDLQADAARIACVVDPRLVKLCARAMPGVEWVEPNAAQRLRASDFDVMVAMGSLPAAYRRRRDQFPGAPYLQAGAEAQAAWAERLGPRRSRLRIGISWRGGIVRTNAAGRSMPLETLAAALPDADLVSLQYGEAEAEVAAAAASLGRPITVFPPRALDDFDALAGLVANLDLVVSVQTTIVHLCGALGRPAFVMVPKRPEWRYGAAGETLPWYRSIRLFRQGQHEDWAAVVARVAEAVAAFAP